jgi:hypothetical protein
MDIGSIVLQLGIKGMPDNEIHSDLVDTLKCDADSYSAVALHVHRTGF